MTKPSYSIDFTKQKNTSWLYFTEYMQRYSVIKDIISCKVLCEGW